MVQTISESEIRRQAAELKRRSDELIASIDASKVTVKFDGPAALILNERDKTHGSFKDNADIFEKLICVLQSTPNWQSLRSEQRLALTMDALKTARILSEGAPVDFREPWDDKAGYATLGGNTCSSS